MKTILPYEGNLDNGIGAFISPKNELLLTNGSHENFSREYCYGSDYEFLLKIKSGDPYYVSCLKGLDDNSTLEGYSSDIDVFSSSKLTKDELNLFKLWLKCNNACKRNFYADFMVFVLGFDKVEKIMKNAITTTNSLPHVRFYNYYLMDWYVDLRTPMVYDDTLGKFKYSDHFDFYIRYNEDEKVAEEIDEIKSYTLIKDRHLFFR